MSFSSIIVSIWGCQADLQAAKSHASVNNEYNTMRFNQRSSSELRHISITRNFTKHAEGSVLVCFGDTKVICTASITPGVPTFLKGSEQGWITAEYGMLPRSTHTRMPREAAKGKQSGRTQEIQRLIGRSLRTAINLASLGEYTVTVDCDVIQADGGTRTAAITGASVALYDALRQNPDFQLVLENFTLVAAVSVGIVEGKILLDLDYAEDSTADTDLNLVMTANNTLIEIQGTAEKHSFTQAQLMDMLQVAQHGIQSIIALQRQVLELTV